ncbi:hypothetical protein BCR32DRAFT_287959 [Anaeromyces robustus]|uniref:Uncharacterized protein n=1 Tax=Anaeromyces robustus TaxID=1754192 RepID=A0A1Y1VPZ2_9FUNG|nr:hypothetical protein BCR32DRAFT_287959 [Anaeromyces robustus]|eukprot:ORX62503.1 hypothetical protein BCR32DRAFT_287959 [Anaeromyces robustus]
MIKLLYSILYFLSCIIFTFGLMVRIPNNSCPSGLSDSNYYCYEFCFEGRQLRTINSKSNTYRYTLTLGEGINIIYIEKGNFGYENRYQSLSSNISDKESLHVIYCVQYSNGDYECKSAPGYIKDLSNYYTLLYNGKSYVKSTIDNGTEFQNDCNINVGDRGINFVKENKDIMITFDSDDENIFADSDKYEYNNFALKIYSKGEYSGIMFFNLANGVYCVNRETSEMSKDKRFCKTGIIDKYNCENGNCYLVTSTTQNETFTTTTNQNETSITTITQNETSITTITQNETSTTTTTQNEISTTTTTQNEISTTTTTQNEISTTPKAITTTKTTTTQKLQLLLNHYYFKSYNYY